MSGTLFTLKVYSITTYHNVKKHLKLVSVSKSVKLCLTLDFKVKKTKSQKKNNYGSSSFVKILPKSNKSTETYLKSLCSWLTYKEINSITSSKPCTIFSNQATLQVDLKLSFSIIIIWDKLKRECSIKINWQIREKMLMSTSSFSFKLILEIYKKLLKKQLLLIWISGRICNPKWDLKRNS